MILIDCYVGLHLNPQPPSPSSGTRLYGHASLRYADLLRLRLASSDYVLRRLLEPASLLEYLQNGSIRHLNFLHHPLYMTICDIFDRANLKQLQQLRPSFGGLAPPSYIHLRLGNV